ncbi:hypothetical protein F2P81_013931 [Scophthalmus maximus]|uniref:Uncharacterized protein n=1 Tax=Scophthalmus maximus TaxID=52904 RepID=A0A6A4SMS3_SCOMX|nr:hypothetical protein F2P81_013931 [Scophthalmus maximus]
MPTRMCGLLTELLDAGLCVVRRMSGCGVALAHGCVVPDVSAKPVSSPGRIAGTRSEKGKTYAEEGTMLGQLSFNSLVLNSYDVCDECVMIGLQISHLGGQSL